MMIAVLDEDRINGSKRPDEDLFGRNVKGISARRERLIAEAHCRL
jgi:hypothetical protein